MFSHWPPRRVMIEGGVRIQIEIQGEAKLASMLTCPPDVHIGIPTATAEAAATRAGCNSLYSIRMALVHRSTAQCFPIC